MTGVDPKTPIVVDPSRPIRIPATLKDETQPDFKFVTPASKVGDILAQISYLIERTCVRRGISLMSLKDQAGFASGYALKIANSKLDRRRVDNIPLARAALLQWWEIVKRIHNVHAMGPDIPEDAAIEIDFPEPEYQENPATLLDQDIKEIEAGLSSPVAVLMRRNPDLDEAAALKLYEQNLAYRRSVKTRYGLSDILAGQPVNPNEGGNGQR